MLIDKLVKSLKKSADLCPLKIEETSENQAFAGFEQAEKRHDHVVREIDRLKVSLDAVQIKNKQNQSIPIFGEMVEEAEFGNSAST